MTDKKKPRPLTAKELRRRIQSGEIRIELASQISMLALGPYVDRVVAALEELSGISGSLVTDESCVCDFIPAESDERAENQRALRTACEHLGKKLGIELDGVNGGHDRIVQIAYKLKQHERSRDR